MKAVLLRVGIDTGLGGMLGPLFADGTFEFVPIPDLSNSDHRTYGNTPGRHGRLLVDYFPKARRPRMAEQPMHVDPEFDTFTYGDPSLLKSGLRRLEPGDLFIFYSGLRGWDVPWEPALHIVGFFVVQLAGWAREMTDEQLADSFAGNFHVRHGHIFAEQRDRLILVKGGPRSRLLTSPYRISEPGLTRTGKPLHVFSGEAREIFGTFGGRVSIQRCPPHWITEPVLVNQTARLIYSLE